MRMSEAIRAAAGGNRDRVELRHALRTRARLRAGERIAGPYDHLILPDELIRATIETAGQFVNSAKRDQMESRLNTRMKDAILATGNDDLYRKFGFWPWGDA
jgi:hypothetical protein